MGKQWGEKFFLKYSAVWIAWFSAIVIFELYEHFAEWEYLIVGLAMALPCWFAPLLIPGQVENLNDSKLIVRGNPMFTGQSDTSSRPMCGSES